MAIVSLDNYIASQKQNLIQKKTASLTTVALMLSSVHGQTGNPGAGTLAGVNTANGVVPTNANAGFPAINAFQGGAKGYITRALGYNSVSSTMHLVDVLFKAGAYSFNANTVLTAQPSFAGRVPGGTDFTGLELWIEAVTAFIGNLSIAVTYTNESGVTGRTTGTIATGIAPIVGRCIKLNLQSGDKGIQKIESVTATVSTAGTFNVLIVRPLVRGRIPLAGGTFAYDLYGTGMPEVFADSALGCYVTPDSTASGLPEWEIEVANF